MIEVFDRTTRRRTAILENAHAILENERINAVNYLSFSLPDQDQKNRYCQPFCYVRRDGGELYRIMPSSLVSEETGSVTYQCEHVLATLIDNILWGYHVVGNLGVYTADVIRYILDHQIVKNWVLDECDYRNQYEYGWQQESLLSALFSVAKPLAGRYIWRTDTSVYPWRLSLKRLDTTGKPELYLRRRHNLTELRRDSDPQQIVTRLYPLGYGEGVNQLGIASVNGGVPYLQSPKSVTDKYGIIERAWIDRRYEDPISLKAAAQAMLEEIQEPLAAYEVGYRELGQSEFDRAEVGKRVRIVDPDAGLSVDTFVTEIKREFDNVENSTVVVANKETAIASTLADMADRQRIEESYAQGATQIYSQALQANCDSASGAVMDFFIPEEMRIINKVLVKIRVAQFRAYSSSTESSASKLVTSASSESQICTSSSGGGSSTTSSGGGGTSTTTDSSAQDIATSSSVVLSAENIMPENASIYNAAKHNHAIPDGAKLAYWGGKDDNGNVVSAGYAVFNESGAHSHGAHNHTVAIRPHNHNLNLPDHTHNVTIQNHTHNTLIPSHSHNVEIPAHTHDITPGIFQFGNPQKFSLYVNGVLKANFSGQTAELDVTPFLVGSDNMIPRGSWLSLEVRPDDLAYISMDLIVQGFIQSRGDKTV